MKKYISLIVLSFLLTTTSYAQNEYNTNKTTISLGGPIGFANIKIEKDVKILNWLKWRNSITLLKGVYYNSDQDTPAGIIYGTEVAILTHPYKSGLDLSAGLGITLLQLGSDRHLNNGRLNQFMPLINIGYRIRLDERYTLRFGAGFPYFLNIGIGF